MIKELEDYNWFPAILRQWQLEFVGAVSVWTKLYHPLATVLDEMIVNDKTIAWQDLCSGSAAPAIDLYGQLKKKIPLTLTDKYPGSILVNNNGVSYSAIPVDVLTIQPVADTVYTMFNAFHHFTATQQNEWINKMARHKTNFIIAEILEPGLLTMLKIFITGTIIQLLTAPFVKPFSLKRLFFTYIIPVNLFTVTYDGIISVWRSRRASQYKQLFENIEEGTYNISVNTIHNWKGNLVYIKGEPANT